MRILVTGGAGYIGSATSRLLARAGHQVTVLDHLGRGHPDAVPGLRLVVADCRDSDAVAALLRAEGIEAVVHFAAHKSVEESLADPGAYFDNNVGGTLAVLRAMAASSVRRFVFSSSCAVYGPPERLPVGEDAALRPMNPYGESKLLAERLLPWFDTATASARRPCVTSTPPARPATVRPAKTGATPPISSHRAGRGRRSTARADHQRHGPGDSGRQRRP